MLHIPLYLFRPDATLLLLRLHIGSSLFPEGRQLEGRRPTPAVPHSVRVGTEDRRRFVVSESFGLWFEEENGLIKRRTEGVGLIPVGRKQT